jgi:translation initiation factor eIF-2B subunit epsilon
MTAIHRLYQLNKPLIVASLLALRSPELFVFCVHHASQVQSYVESSSWTSVIKVICVVENSILNAGDALRELDKRGLIRSDPFIMVSGDVVTNVDIRGALVEHKKRKKKDSSAIMTILLKQRDSMSTTRQVCDDLLVGVNGKTNQITLFHDDITSNETEVPTSFFDIHGNISIRSDLLDCGIDICSPDVLARFSDEFDYKEIRKQFVANIVSEEEEGLQSKVRAQGRGAKRRAEVFYVYIDDV